MPDIQQETFTDRPEDEGVVHYRAVSALAIVGLLVGLLTPLAFWHPVLWVVPVAGATLALLAVRRIDHRAAELVGRRVAVFALCLSLICLAGAPSRYVLLMYRGMVDAREQGLRWFAALREGQAELASQFTKEPTKRQPEGTDLVDFYRREPGASEYLRRFVADPIAQAVLKLGASARVRYLGTEDHRETSNKELLIGVYAVTYEEDGALKSFFVRLTLERTSAAPRHVSQWWIIRDELLTGPPEMLQPAA